jgi:hypothetical protein
VGSETHSPTTAQRLLEKREIYGKIDIKNLVRVGGKVMTRRQQLILLVLGLATVSTCTVAFAMAMNLSRQMAVSASVAEIHSAAEPARTERGQVWQLPPTPLSQPEVVPTFTPLPTPTNTRVPTWTPSPTYTPTATRVPTDTPVPTSTQTPVPAPTSEVPAQGPTPAAPTPTPTPEFPFVPSVETFDTGTPQMTRVTGMVWKVISVNLALYDGQPGYQMRLVDPNGNVHLSDVSGPGGTDSTCAECGDNQRMNMKIEIRPYVPGTYRVALVQGEEQMSSEVEFTLAADPLQYVHVKFVPWD